MTQEDKMELMELRRNLNDHGRWFSVQEFDRLKELMRIEMDDYQKK